MWGCSTFWQVYVIRNLVLFKQVAKYFGNHHRMFIRHIPVSNPYGAAVAVQIGFPADLSILAMTCMDT